MNSAEFQTLLQNYTGKNLNDFFQNWVFNGGYPVFVIDSMQIQNISSNLFIIKTYIKQKLHGANHYFNQVPMSISFFDNNWTPTTIYAVLSGSISTITTTLSFVPQFVILNDDKKLAYASIGDKQIIKNTGNISFPNAKVSLNVINKGSDSSFVYIEHHYAAPDTQNFIQNGDRRYKFSNQHYWKVSGKLSNGFYAKIRLNYNGNIIYSGYGCMDTCLTSIHSDSIVVLYRKSAKDKWRPLPFLKYSSGPKAGILLVDSMQIGEYTFANKNGYYTNVGIQSLNNSHSIWRIYPNPCSAELQLDLDIKDDTEVQLESMDGKNIRYFKLAAHQTCINVSDLSSGMYILKVKDKTNIWITRFVKE